MSKQELPLPYSTHKQRSRALYNFGTGADHATITYMGILLHNPELEKMQEAHHG
jgi:hypothetical protein